ncbi:unnamed protein product [Rotaria socialis]|uniref:VCBS repeat-containing protein n=1 Tax=Rotaria socialis TaxID=392032 RepID=A0A820XTC8_9BILA|nr:unnamed protein product [Rotaria socialis]CAF3412349.1 unnamed protein product [Rotaria socialis]CAF3496123.1 unnamed protein product [Rotaria socialis]CAF3496852.1 unnamed protein product [Rotaria socialis]CAF4129313.1 unnamed protein product [Rotaria socialis]
MEYSCGITPLAVAIGDFNNDTRLDLVITNKLGRSVSVLLGYSNQAFIQETALTTGNKLPPRSFAIADFNNDNQKDISVVNLGANNVGIFLRNSNHSFTSQKRLLTDSTPMAITVGEFNNDSFIDIVVTNYDSGNVGVFLGYGNGSFFSQKTFTTGSLSYPRAVAVGDFNNDMFVDIIVANYGINNVGILLGYGNGLFLDVNLFSMGYESLPFFVSVGDFNGDRKLDFAVINEDSDSLEIFLQTC